MFDPKCYELAEHFLPDDATEARKNEFAQDLQDYIEVMLFGAGDGGRGSPVAEAAPTKEPT